MALRRVSNDIRHVGTYILLSSDTKPSASTTGPPHPGDQLYETDTCTWYLWDGLTWITRPSFVSLDFSGDIEISGEAITNLYIEAASTGANTVLTVGAAERVKVYKALISCESDVTGLVKLTVGSTDIAGVYSPKAGGQYILISNYPDYYHGAVGEDIVLTTPDATDIHLNLSYTLYTP